MADVLLDRRQMLCALTGGGLAAAGLGLGGPARGADKPIALDKVPAKVKEAADKAVPGAKWTGATMSTEGDTVLYELEGTNAKGRNVGAYVGADETVGEIQTEIPFEEAPDVVKKALKAKLPKFKVTATYEIREEGEVVRYDFEGKKQPKDKEDISVFVSPDGKEVKPR